MMASEPKKAKAEPAPTKAEPPAKVEAPAKDKSTPGDGAAKVEGSEATAAAPSNYSRGEGQKPVTRAYKENWNAIFAKNAGKKSVAASVKKRAKKSTRTSGKKGARKKSVKKASAKKKKQ
jgi:hypothetical protein